MGIINRCTALLCPSLLLAAAWAGAQEKPELQRASMMLPATTASSSARDHFAYGERALDVGRVNEARTHFQEAVQADPSFAFGYLRLANTALSTTDYKANLDRAIQYAPGASRSEQLLIDIARKGLEGNVEGQLDFAQQLVRVEATNPRAWLTLAAVQQALRRESSARETMERAATLAPKFVPAYLDLSASFATVEPRDLEKAERYARTAVQLEPNEPAPHDALGDVHRQLGELESARWDYTRAAELDPTNGLMLQQRGHVNSFLGRFDAARADYAAAAAIGRNNEPASFMVWHAIVSVHAGKPKAAVDEIERLVQAIDGMGIPDPDGTKAFALSEQITMALHSGMYDVAERSIERYAVLQRREGALLRSEEVKRRIEADIAYQQGRLAVRQGNYKLARAKAAAMMKLREPDRNPRKHELAHELLGMTALRSGAAAEAVTHFDQANPNDIYTTYHHALALAGSGRASEASALFQRVANYRFNTAGLALVREDAIARTK